MRLWHQKLIHYLDNKRLLGQHRECCALRGKGWGKKHSVVDYVFKHGLDHLYAYHCLVMHEMASQFNANIDAKWYNRLYRGKSLPESTLVDVGTFIYSIDDPTTYPFIYSEHNDKYLLECLVNLKSKGAELVNGESIAHMIVGLNLKGILEKDDKVEMI